MDFVQQRHQLQIKQEVEQEQKVCLESLSNQPKGQQEMNKNNTSEFGLLCKQERNKKRSIEQLDQQILIKTKKIAELGRLEILKKQQLGEVMQKVQSQKRMLVMLESQAQKDAETWKSNFENLEQNWNCRVAEINAEEERMLKKVEDKERSLRIEIAQKETVEREKTRKEFELELVKKSIAEGYAKLKKIHRQTKLVQNYRYLQQMVSMPANQQSLPIHHNQPYLPDSPVDVEQCVPPQPLQPIIPNQPIQSELFSRLSPSAQPSQPVGQFYNQQKLQPQRLMVQDELIRRTAAAVNPNLSSLPPPATTAEFDSSFNTTTTAISNNASSIICYVSSTSTLVPTVTSTLPKSFSSFSSVASTSVNFSTTTSEFASSPTLTSSFANSSTSTTLSAFNVDNPLPIYSKLIPSTTTLTLPESPSSLSPITLTESSMLTSLSFSANLDKSSTTVAKSLNLDNGIEIITIDDSDEDDEEEPEQQQQNSQASSENIEGKLRSEADINNRPTLESKGNGRGRKRKRNSGGAETSEQSKQSKRERLLAQMKERYKQRIANETPEEREHRLAQKREYEKQKRANETPEQHKCRLAKQLVVQYNYRNRKKQQS